MPDLTALAMTVTLELTVNGMLYGVDGVVPLVE
jgi:hypothetical protein